MTPSGRHALGADRAGYHPAMTDSPPTRASSTPRRRSTTPRLVRREDETESLAYFWVRFDGEPTPFEPGQYMTIGVMVDGQDRPAAVLGGVAAGAWPATDGYEFYVRLVQGGTFTPLLWGMPIGQRMRMIGPKGKFMLEPDDDRTHIFISSGTGNAPFVSMMRQLLVDGRPRRGRLPQRRVVRARARLPRSLEDWEASGAYPVTYIPTVSRPDDPRNADWTGRTGRVESILGAGPRRARPDRRPTRSPTSAATRT